MPFWVLGFGFADEVTDITFCGDWAGNSYASAPNCPGTCEERLLDPGNFVVGSLLAPYMWFAQ